MKTIRRAFSLLTAFNGGGSRFGVTELAGRVGLHKSTVSRMLLTLEELGAVQRDPASERYSLGPAIVRLAANLPFSDYLVAMARPALVALAQATDETVNFCLPAGDEVLHADQASTERYLVGRRNWVGMTCPMHCASNGKVLLAYMPAGEVETYLARPLAPLTAHTLTDPVLLRAELATIRQNGYAWGQEELEIGLVGVSAPVFMRGGLVVACVNLSGPVYRFPEEKRPELARLTVEAARHISEQLQR